jgi:hypothetical protein
VKVYPTLKLIDLPRPCDGRFYDRTIEKVVAFIGRHMGVNSVYQVGSIRNPGISDIDLLLVVSDDAQCDASPFAILTDEERYLFTHSCFVIPESLAPELARYSLLHGYRKLYGVTWGWESDGVDGGDLETLREQTAMEFLVKNLLDLYVQLQYRVVKVRALLQHAKGLRLDLALLQIDRARSVELADEAVSLIENWFDMRDPEPRVAHLATDLLPALRDTVDETSRRVRLYAPATCPLAFAPNMTIHHEASVNLYRWGLRFPNILGLADRRHFNAHHRVNRFRLGLPMNVAPPGSYHALRFDFLRRVRSFVDARFPAFSAPMPPLFYRAV